MKGSEVAIVNPKPYLMSSVKDGCIAHEVSLPLEVVCKSSHVKMRPRLQLKKKQRRMRGSERRRKQKCIRRRYRAARAIDAGRDASLSQRVVHAKIAGSFGRDRKRGA